MKRKRELPQRKFHQLKKVHDVRRLVVKNHSQNSFSRLGERNNVTIHFGKSDENEIVISSKDIKKALRSLNKKGRVVDLREESVRKVKEYILQKQKDAQQLNNQTQSLVDSTTDAHEKEKNKRERELKDVSSAIYHDTESRIKGTKKDPKRTKNDHKTSPKKQVVTGLSYGLWSKNARRSIALFTLLCFIFSFSIKSFASVTDSAYNTKDSVVSNAEMAYEYIKSASGSLGEKDFSMAEYKFGIAAERFFSSKGEIDSLTKGVDSVLELIPGGTQVGAAENLLEAGGNFAVAGEYISKALEPFKDSQDVFAAVKENQNEQDRSSNFDPRVQSLTDALEQSRENLTIAQEKIKAAEESLEKVNTDKLPDNIKEKVRLIKDKIPEVSSSFGYFMSYADVLLKILGHDSLKRYLILFQNNSEIRAGGGFIGTYAKVDLNEGKITHMIVEGPYNIDGQMNEKIKSPEAMHLINNRFYMRDANWFADFPTSAKKASSLYEKAGGPTVDGVISINASVIEDLLKLTGPIDMPEYELTITSQNFFEETQREVEISYDKELNKPKKFVSDLIPKMLEKITQLDQKRWIDALMLLTRMFEEKEIMIYFNQDDLEKAVFDMGWSGEIKATDKDYLDIVNSNIGGGKTDREIEQKVHMETSIQSDGSVINTITLTKTHHGDPNNFWTRVKNVSYTRFYVPEGSELIEAKGFDSDFYKMLIPDEEGALPDPDLQATEGRARVDELSKTRIYTESGKTVFGNFIGVEAGMTKVVQVSYKTPFKIKLSTVNPVSHYSMLFQKQSGSEPIKMEYIISYPLLYQATWQYLTDSDPERKFRRLEASFLLDKDKTLAVVFSQ